MYFWHCTITPLVAVFHRLCIVWTLCTCSAIVIAFFIKGCLTWLGLITTCNWIPVGNRSGSVCRSYCNFQKSKRTGPVIYDGFRCLLHILSTSGDFVCRMSKRLSAPVHRAALLGCHGLNDAALQTAYRAITVARLTYATSASWGFTTSGDRRQFWQF